MIIKASAVLRNDYTSISNMAKNGEGDLVLMSIDAFERREEMLKLREKVLQAEQERMDGAETLTIAQARGKLRERLHDI